MLSSAEPASQEDVVVNIDDLFHHYIKHDTTPSNQGGLNWFPPSALRRVKFSEYYWGDFDQGWRPAPPNQSNRLEPTGHERAIFAIS